MARLQCDTKPGAAILGCPHSVFFRCAVNFVI